MQKATTERPEYLEGVQILTKIGEDLRQVFDLRSTVDEQLFRRLLARTLFPLLDALANYLKALALLAHEQGNITFPKKFLKILQEGEEVKEQDGRTRWIPHFAGIKKNLKVSLNTYAQTRKTETPLASIAPMPQAFDDCLEVRNRITHPRKIAHLTISDKETEALFKVGLWFLKLIEWFNEQEQKEIDRIKQDISDKFRRAKEQMWRDVGRKPEQDTGSQDSMVHPGLPWVKI